ncbi:MAG: 5-methyltetrahydropteroyltriglutamate--homocysteine S-methyltransferase [Gemmatimonadetes bacterium]|nr:5-methyltetrahydropteroyltriglutamate--homocysteine S-methyltransferase [Gemmatimonadota bacterium]
MTLAANLGFPRIGPDRELKRVTERYWAGRVDEAELQSVAAELRAANWRLQAEVGLDLVPSNDFSLYDHVLDTIALLGAVPPRYGWEGDAVGLDVYFAMARGAQSEALDVPAMEMTKWFDTNYHYIVPEFWPGQSFRAASSKPFDEFREALALGMHTRPVLLGPVSFLLLGKTREGSFDPLAAHLEAVTSVYAGVLRELFDLGAEWVQLDEPCFVEDRSAAELEALAAAYGALAEAKGGGKLLVQTYFGHVGEAYPVLAALPVEGLGLDLVRGRGNQDLIDRHGFPEDKHLSAGVVDGRNVWLNDFGSSLDQLEGLASTIGADRLIVSPSCSLLHVPIDAASETELDDELRSWLSFATQKLAELDTLKRGLESGRGAIADELKINRERLDSRAASPRTRNPTVRQRLGSIDPLTARREESFSERSIAQQERLGLPALPATTIGSFPQHTEVRKKRLAFRRGELDRDSYVRFVEAEIQRCIEVQEDAGLDVLVHGEFERNDMVEYFAQRFEGYAFTRNGWVGSYGSRYVKPPILFGDVSRPDPITVRWWKAASSRTKLPVKGMLTGPVTMLQWSFVRDDQPRSDTCYQLALAVGDEVLDLEAAGAPIIQVDEPALREGLPLRRSEWDEYLRWAVAAFRLATSGVRADTQVHTHMCYSEFNDIIDHIARMDADVLLIENARSDKELLEVFRDFEYERAIGPGVYDIHSPRVPSVEEMAAGLRASLRVLPVTRLWVVPDCGLKTRAYEEVIPALTNMVAAARVVREAPETANTEASDS